MDNVEFIENKGQWNNKVVYKAQLPAGSLYLENKDINFFLDSNKELPV